MKVYLVTQLEGQQPLHLVGVFDEGAGQQAFLKARQNIENGLNAEAELIDENTLRVKTATSEYRLRLITDRREMLNRAINIGSSSLCSKIGYCTKENALAIHFKPHRGDMNSSGWKYSCPVDLFYGMLIAPSMGRFYNSMIKGQYDGVQYL